MEKHTKEGKARPSNEGIGGMALLFIYTQAIT